MHPALRRVLAVISGLGVSTGVVLAVESINSRRYAPTTGMDWRNQEQLAAYIASLPTAAFATVLAGWLLGAFLGGSVAIRVGRDKPQLYAGIVGGVVGLGAALNFFSFTHPVWMMVATVILLPLVVIAAIRLAPAQRSASNAPSA